jgi:hypothetical protein
MLLKYSSLKQPLEKPEILVRNGGSVKKINTGQCFDFHKFWEEKNRSS